jgi:uncharacterized membrane protein
LPCALVKAGAVVDCILLYERHAVDYDRIELKSDALTVMQCSGTNVNRLVLKPPWVSVYLDDGANPKIQIQYAGQAMLD